MYNRYIPNGTAYTRVVLEDAPPPPHARPQHTPPPSHAQSGHAPQPESPSLSDTLFGGGKLPFALPSFLFGKGKEEGEGGGLSGLLKSLKLDSLDSGDVLLLLIVLFLLLEGDNLELVIALGLVLIMGLTDDKKE